MDVDAVQQGPGDLGAVALDLVKGAGALPLGIAQEPAGAAMRNKS
ncbi:MAG: hypothetical protein AB1512_03065 [Thermodesulfobacteriota bacterium]